MSSDISADMQQLHATVDELRRELADAKRALERRESELEAAILKNREDRQEVRRVLQCLNEEVSARLSAQSIDLAAFKLEFESEIKSRETELAKHKRRRKEEQKGQRSKVRGQQKRSSAQQNNQAQRGEELVLENRELREIAGRLLKSFMARLAEDVDSSYSSVLQHIKDSKEKRLRKSIEHLRMSGVFDDDWYRSSNPDVSVDGVDPAQHFIEFGFKEGRAPNARLGTT